uniref:Integrase_H2C2 domain-containing protein n=1 Tax=Pristionchus pacificus TaxID=54126 RepID=A0A8R1YNW8_PRIPA
MSQLGMMDESKGLIHNEDETQEEEVEEEYILDNGTMSDDIAMGYAEEEEVLCEEDEHRYQYGGMEHELYDAIVEYKRTGRYPEMADQRVDRSAHCHWRLRCGRFSMHEDRMTLMYGGENTHVELPKFVIKKGEVEKMIDRVHSLIGHVGTKRTQAALQKRMYWRSVRNDVIEFVKTCDFCHDKKMQGKKLSKAPIDIQSDAFDLDIHVEYTTTPNQRFIRVALEGFDEEFVKAAAMSKMTSYTFRSTDSEHRKIYRTPPFFKRQPYLRRSRFEQNNQSAFLVPVLNRETREPTYMTLSASRMDCKYIDDIEEDELTTVDPTVASTSAASANERLPPTDDSSTAAPVPTNSHNRTSTLSWTRGLRHAKVYDPNHPTYRRANTERAIKESRQPKRNDQSAMRGAASRLSIMIAQHSLRHDSQSTSSHGLVGHDVITPFDEARERPEFTPLAPVLLMPSNDPEVAELQKELLSRQLEIQKMQLRVLQAHEHRMSIEGARFDESDVREDVEELNVIDADGYS